MQQERSINVNGAKKVKKKIFNKWCICQVFKQKCQISTSIEESVEWINFGRNIFRYVITIRKQVHFHSLTIGKSLAM